MNVIMVGKPNLSTDHLLSVLRGNIAEDCRLLSEHSMLLGGSPDTLYVMDMAVLKPASCAEALSTLHAQGMRRAALINVSQTANQTQLASLPGVCGIFSTNMNHEDLIRGMKAIMTGQYWLPRQVLCEHLEKTRQKFQSSPSGNIVKLSLKERQLLTLLTQGCSNDAIANHLAISPHTVKAHFYTLYRKLQVHNRVQAVTWAQQHSDAMEGRL